MWRSHFDADWERRKNYLIRSLFNDLPLSPVPEEDESFDSTRSRIRPLYSPSSPHPAPRSTHDRPYSPLPPLIIEREPNRHDEPEEYYKQLEKRVLKVYRKLFIEGKSDISDNTSDTGETVDRFDTSERRTSVGVMNNDENNFGESLKSDEMSIEIDEKSGRKRISERNTDVEASDSKKSRSSYSSYTEVEDVSDSYSADKNTNVDVQNEGVENLTDTSLYPADNSTNKSSENEVNVTSDTLSTHSDNSNKEKANKAEVDDINNTTSSHPDSRNKNTRSKESVAESNHKDHRIVTFQADVHIDTADDDGFVVAPPIYQSVDISEDKMAENVSDGGSAILENNEVSDHSHTYLTEVIPEIEVMRSTQIHLSVGSHNQDNASSDSDTTAIAMGLVPQLEAFTDSDSSNVDDNYVENHSPSRKRSLSLSNDSINEVGTQTSLNYNRYERMNADVSRDIFVGAPKVFRLCPCVSHHCSC